MRYSFFAVKSTRCGMIPFHGRSWGRRSGEGHADDVRPAVGAVRVRRGSGASAVRQDARWPVCRQVVTDGLAPAAFVWQSLGRTAAARCGERQAAFNATRGAGRRFGSGAQRTGRENGEWRQSGLGCVPNVPPALAPSGLGSGLRSCQTRRGAAAPAIARNHAAS